MSDDQCPGCLEGNPFKCKSFPGYSPAMALQYERQAEEHRRRKAKTRLLSNA